MLPPRPYADELKALETVLDSRVLSGYRVSSPAGGPFCRAAEARLEELYGGRAFLTTSGTTALELALRAVGVSRFDRVIVPAYTMMGTAEAVLAIGAEPVLCDVNPITGVISPEEIAEVMHNWEGIVPPAAIMAVHIHNQVAPIPAIANTFRGIPIVEDCAQAFYTKSGVLGLLAGTLGDAAALSFKQGKVVHCGEGGAVLTQKEAVASQLSLLRNHGACRADTFGGNHCMSELQAAVLSVRLKHLENLGARHTWAKWLAHNTRKTAYMPLDMSGGPFIYGVLAPPSAPVPAGFTRTYHKPLCCMPFFKAQGQSCLVQAHAFAHNMMWCPCPSSQGEATVLAGAVNAAWASFYGEGRGEGV